MSAATTLTPSLSPLLKKLRRGFQVGWSTLFLLAAINTGIAAVLWVGDDRPFWQPLLTVQLYGFSIAYCVNLVTPWSRPRPILRLALAVAAGTLIGVCLVILVKGYNVDYIVDRAKYFAMNIVAGFANGLFVSLFFYVKHRERIATERLHRAEAERLLSSRHAVEAELKLMQAQVEPHFLFNTLASVQYLTETDPPEASRLLGHLTDYLRHALPQLRAHTTTLGKEVGLARAYLNILKMRLRDRLSFAIELDPELTDQPFPPNMLISLVENAIQHGIEPSADGGSVTLRATARDGMLTVAVDDSGSGPADRSSRGHGVGLSNLRERLAALYGTQAHFALEPTPSGGTRALLAVPLDAAP